eukprot:s6334_g2.t1
MAASQELPPCTCPHARSRLERSRSGLELLHREHEGFSPELRAALTRQRGCHRAWEPGRKLRRLVEARGRANSSLTSACAAGRIAALVLCSQKLSCRQRLLSRDYVGVLRNLEEANALVPFASHCLERLLPGQEQDPDWLLSREEVYDNFRSVVRALGSIAMDTDAEGNRSEAVVLIEAPEPEEESEVLVAADEDEEADDQKETGFFQQPAAEQEATCGYSALELFKNPQFQIGYALDDLTPGLRG